MDNQAEHSSGSGVFSDSSENKISKSSSKTGADDKLLSLLQTCILKMLNEKPVYLEGFGFIFLKEASHTLFTQEKGTSHFDNGIEQILCFEQCDDAVHISVFKEYFETSHITRALKNTGLLESTSFLRQWLRNCMKNVKNELSHFGVSRKFPLLGEFVSLSNKSILLLRNKETTNNSLIINDSLKYVRPLLTSSMELFTAVYGSPISVNTILLSEFLGSGFEGSFALASFQHSSQKNCVISLSSGLTPFGVEFVTESISSHPWEASVPGWINEIYCIAYYLIQTISVSKLGSPIIAELPHTIAGLSHVMISERSGGFFRHVSKQGEFLLFNITGLKAEEAHFAETYSPDLLLRTLLEKKIIGTWKNRKLPIVTPPVQDSLAH